MKREEAKNLLNPSVELIPAYKPLANRIPHDSPKHLTPAKWAERCATKGGFNPCTREFTPMKFASADMWVHEALDNITAALEAGVVDANGWSTQLFASDEDLEMFLEELECYDDCYRITDRWWWAIAKLVGTVEEVGLITCADIVDELRTAIERGQRRQEVLVKEAEYFATHPVKKPKLNAEQRATLLAHNYKTQQAARRKEAEEDVSVYFRFSDPIFQLKRGVLSARQATTEDCAALVAKAEKSRSKRRKAA